MRHRPAKLQNPGDRVRPTEEHPQGKRADQPHPHSGQESLASCVCHLGGWQGAYLIPSRLLVSIKKGWTFVGCRSFDNCGWQSQVSRENSASQDLENSNEPSSIFSLPRPQVASGSERGGSVHLVKAESRLRAGARKKLESVPKSLSKGQP